MTGFVPDREKIFFYNLASLFVYPSFYEGFGFPPLEAMASGCPVLTSQNSALSEVCGDAALLIDPNDIASICNGLNELLQNRDFYIQKGLINAQKFRWQTAAQCFLIETK
jgi:glycosyltransferase involved in cell wall biosynthesis